MRCGYGSLWLGLGDGYRRTKGETELQQAARWKVLSENSY